MDFRSEEKDSTLILYLSGDLIGEESGEKLVAEADAFIAREKYDCIVDISNLRYINSSGIGILITLLTKFRNRGGDVCLLQPSESVQKLLIITKLNAIFNVAESEEEAFEKLKSQA